MASLYDILSYFPMTSWAGLLGENEQVPPGDVAAQYGGVNPTPRMSSDLPPDRRPRGMSLQNLSSTYGSGMSQANYEPLPGVMGPAGEAIPGLNVDPRMAADALAQGAGYLADDYAGRSADAPGGFQGDLAQGVSDIANWFAPAVSAFMARGDEIKEGVSSRIEQGAQNRKEWLAEEERKATNARMEGGPRMRSGEQSGLGGLLPKYAPARGDQQAPLPFGVQPAEGGIVPLRDIGNGIQRETFVSGGSPMTRYTAPGGTVEAQGLPGGGSYIGAATDAEAAQRVAERLGVDVSELPRDAYGNINATRGRDGRLTTFAEDADERVGAMRRGELDEEMMSGLVELAQRDPALAAKVYELVGGVEADMAKAVAEQQAAETDRYYRRQQADVNERRVAVQEGKAQREAQRDAEAADPANTRVALETYRQGMENGQIFEPLNEWMTKYAVGAGGVWNPGDQEIIGPRRISALAEQIGVSPQEAQLSLLKELNPDAPTESLMKLLEENRALGRQ